MAHFGLFFTYKNQTAVEHILEKLSAGETFEQILGAYPRLNHESILAAFAFVAETLRSDIIYPILESA